MLRKQWQDYALKAKQIAKHIVTGLEQNKKGVRLVHIVYGLDMYATDALNLKYSKQRSKSSVHTYQGGRQEISTQHADGSEGLFKSNGEFHPTNNPMDTEVKEYMNNNLDENKQYKANTNMNKKLIRLTESDLHRIVKESVTDILNKPGGANPFVHELNCIFKSLANLTSTIAASEIKDSAYGDIFNELLTVLKPYCEKISQAQKYGLSSL